MTETKIEVFVTGKTRIFTVNCHNFKLWSKLMTSIIDREPLLSQFCCGKVPLCLYYRGRLRRRKVVQFYSTEDFNFFIKAIYTSVRLGKKQDYFFTATKDKPDEKWWELK